MYNRSFFVYINNGDSMNEISNIIIRTSLILLIIFIILKLMGKKQVSQMSMFDYITGITIGSIVADISLDINKSLISGIISLLIYCLADILISYLSLKSINLRNFFEGKETPLIINGKINRENMKKSKITINFLQTEARLKGFFNLSEINNAIMEPSGMISFEPKENEKPSTKKDIGLNQKNKGLVYNLIIDGQIIKENLNNVKKNQKWLMHEVKVKGNKLEDILLFTIDNEEKITIYTK